MTEPSDAEPSGSNRPTEGEGSVRPVAQRAGAARNAGRTQTRSSNRRAPGTPPRSGEPAAPPTGRGKVKRRDDAKPVERPATGATPGPRRTGPHRIVNPGAVLAERDERRSASPAGDGRATVAHELDVEDLLAAAPSTTREPAARTPHPPRTEQRAAPLDDDTARPPVPRDAVRTTGAGNPPLGVPAVRSPTRRQVRAARRLQARKVGRLVRHVDLWSLLKVSLLFYVCMLCVCVIAGVLLWTALQRGGAVSSVEGFIQEVFLLAEFRFEGRDMFRIGVLGGMVGVLVLTLLTVLGGLLFNLISDLTGGVRVSVVELESARPASRRNRR